MNTNLRVMRSNGHNNRQAVSIKRLLISLLMTCMTCMVYAQTVLDTARNWVSVEHIDLYSGTTLNDTFNIYVSNTEVKLAHNGLERSFPISNIEGSWANIEEAGVVTFNIQVLDLAGNGTLQREGETLFLVVDLSERKDWMKRKFIINNPQ